MTMLGPILPVQLLQQSKIRPSSVFHIRRTRQTSPQVIFTSLDHSKRRWEASLSGPTKRCSRRCTSGCTLRQKTFYRGIHALLKRWNTCMERNGNYVEKWCHCVPYVFNKLRDKKYLSFHLTHPRMWYFTYWLEDKILRSKHVKLNMEHLELHEYTGDFYAVC